MKRFLSLLLILALALSLFSCNGEESNPAPEEPADPPAEETLEKYDTTMPDLPTPADQLSYDREDTDIVEEILGDITLTYFENKALMIISGKGAANNILDGSKEKSSYFLFRRIEGHRLDRVVIEEGITELNNCFNELKGVTRISLPKSLRSIEQSFINCKDLGRIDIFEKVTAVRKSFTGCENLFNVGLFGAATIEGSFIGCPLLTSLYIPKDSVICGSFNNCEMLAAIRMGGNVSCHTLSEDGCSESFYGTTPARAFYIQEPLHTEETTALSAGIPRLNSTISGAEITILAERNGENPEHTELPVASPVSFDAESGTLTVGGKGKITNLYPRTLKELSIDGYLTEPLATNDQIKKIVIQEGVTTIENCFNDLAALEEIQFPKSLSSIQLSFMGCSALKKLSVPASCKEISIHSFDDCTSLSALTFEGAIKIAPWGGFSGLSSLKKLTIPAGSEICSAFDNCSQLKKVIFQGAIKIHESDYKEETKHNCSTSFYGLHKKCTFYLPKALYDQVKTTYQSNGLVINWYISDFEKYRHVITKEKESSKGGSSSKSQPHILRETHHGNTMTYEIESGAMTLAGRGSFNWDYTNFYYYLIEEEAPIALVVEKGIEEISIRRDLINLTDISLPSSLKKISGSFNDCTKLERIRIPKNVETISDSFHNCPVLDDVVVPKNVKEIRSSFCECASLSNITFKNATLIDGSFRECNALKELSLPNDSILCNSFNQCNELKTIYLGANVSCHDLTVEGCDASFIGHGEGERRIYAKEPLHMDPDTAITAGIDELNMGNAKTRLIPIPKQKGGDPAKVAIPQRRFVLSFDEKSGTLTVEGKGMLEELYPRTIEEAGDWWTYPSLLKEDQKIKKLVIKEGITSLYNCFNDLVALEELSLPESLQEVSSSFMGCIALEELTIPKGLKKINRSSFDSCKSLKKLILQGAIDTCKYGGAFNYLESLREVVIPDGSILCDSFHGCINLEKLTFGENIALHEFINDDDVNACQKSFGNVKNGCLFYLSPKQYQQIIDSEYSGPLSHPENFRYIIFN